MRQHAVAALCVSFFFTVAAHAQSARTFVSAANGNDANNCSRLAPCRTFGAALTHTTSGGEVVVIDSGGYGPVSINQPVSIISPSGVYAGITAPSAPAVDINLGQSATIVLRGLTLNGVGAVDGIRFFGNATQSTLYVDSCFIGGFAATGQTLASGIYADNGRLFVTNTMIRDIGNGDGVSLFSGAVSTIDHVRVENASSAVTAVNSRATIHDTIAVSTGSAFSAQASTTGDVAQIDADHCLAAGGQDGFWTLAGGTGTAEINATNCVVTQNSGIGLHVTNGAIYASNNTVTHNATGMQNDGGTLQSAGDNNVRDNTTDVAGTITTYTRQ